MQVGAISTPSLLLSKPFYKQPTRKLEAWDLPKLPPMAAKIDYNAKRGSMVNMSA